MKKSSINWAIHPGEYIQDELDARGWSQRDLSYILGCPEQSINVIITGKRGISPDMAKALGEAFGVPAEFFINLQKSYELANANDPDPGVAKRGVLQSKFPIREMIKRGWLINTDTNMLSAQIARFFEVNSLDEAPYFPHAAKKTDYAQVSPSQLVWLYRVRQIAKSIAVPKYSEKALSDSIVHLKSLLSAPDEIRHVPRILMECGVRFIVVESLPSARIDGVCFWLDKNSPVIGMSLARDQIDNFWFVLRHEIEHVLKQHGKEKDLGIIDTELTGENIGTNLSLAEEERIANMAAAAFCVPPEKFESFMIRKKPFYYEKDVIAFAKILNIHPGLVVGQMQHRLNRYDYLKRHLVKIRPHILPGSISDGWGNVASVSI